MRTRFLVSVGFTDLLALSVGWMVASLFVFETLLPWESVFPGPRVFPMLSLLAVSMVLMSMLTAQMSGPGVPRPSYGRMSAIFLGTGALTALGIVLARVYFSRLFLLETAAVWLVVATAHRALRRRRPWTERIGVITGEKQLAEDLTHAEHADVAWVLTPDFDGVLDLPERDLTLAVDLRAVLSERVARYLSSCDVAGYTIRPFTSIYEDHTGRVPLVHLAEGWEISAPLLEVAPWLPGKRVFDTVAAVITFPLWALIGLGVGAYVKLASPGPAVFRQKRIGLDGHQFTMYKFRTMVVDAEDEGPRFAVPNDHRLIKGGSFLRKSRLDEIPQLWNVVRGEMSLVGPRAEQVPFVEQFRDQIPFYDHRHLVRPGVTGWAQVSYGYADDHAETIEKLTYDLYYIKHMSPVMDIRILWKSVWTVLTGAGAR